MSEIQDPRFLKGGRRKLEKYGIAGFSAMGKKSWESRKEKNPNAGHELSLLGVHARQVKKQEYIREVIEQEYIRSQIVIKKTLIQTLLGTKTAT